MTFATEHNWDSLDFFDGVDANAPRLGSYSGKSDLTVFELSAPTWISIRRRKNPAADRWDDGADDICHVLWEGCVKPSWRSQRKEKVYLPPSFHNAPVFAADVFIMPHSSQDFLFYKYSIAIGLTLMKMVHMPHGNQQETGDLIILDAKKKKIVIWEGLVQCNDFCGNISFTRWAVGNFKRWISHFRTKLFE